MSDQESDETAEDDSDELHFEDRLFLWLTVPSWPLVFLPPWPRFFFGIWLYIGSHSVWNDWVYAQPTWLIVALVGPIIYLTLFGALPLILYSCLFILLMPWHAPPPPKMPVRSIVRQRAGRLKTAIAQKRDRRVRRGGWIKVGDHAVRAGGDAFGRTRRAYFWIAAVKLPPRIRWSSGAMPKSRRRPAE